MNLGKTFNHNEHNEHNEEKSVRGLARTHGEMHAKLAKITLFVVSVVSSWFEFGFLK